MTINNAEKQVFVSRPTVGPPCEKWNPEPFVRTRLESEEELLIQQEAWLNKITTMSLYRNFFNN